MRWRVRSRRCTTHPLVSVRRLAASTLCLACASLVSAFAVAASASPSLAPASLKEGRAPRAPRLPFLRVGRFHGGEQRTGERVQIERIGPGPRHQLAERSEEPTSELPSLMRISYAVFCLKKKKKHTVLHIGPVTDSTYPSFLLKSW